MGNYVLLFMLLLPVYCVSQTQPTISYITPNQTKRVNSSVEISCAVQYAANFPVVISKHTGSSSDYIVLAASNNIVVRDPRLSIRYNAISATYVLRIDNLSVMDAGIYQCSIVMSMNNRITAETELKMYRLPIITENSTKSLSTTLDGSAKLECYAEGFPKPSIYWYRKNNVILPTGGRIHLGNVLQINYARSTDRGIYYCVADNGAKVPHEITVTVEFPPIMTVSTLKSYQIPIFNSSQDLNCEIEAYPLGDIYWMKNGIELVTDENYKVIKIPKSDHTFRLILQVRRIQQEQLGDYYCKATNKLGSVQQKLELYDI